MNAAGVAQKDADILTRVGERLALKAPKSNIQAPEKLQSPNLKRHGSAQLKLAAWRFFGCWSLEFGAFAFIRAEKPVEALRHATYPATLFSRSLSSIG
jgi:hypothetical protein